MTDERLELVPLTRDEADAFIVRHHRHHATVGKRLGHAAGHLFAIGASLEGSVVAVAVCGRPKARALQDGWTAEVTRLCARDGVRNACSFLYAACWRACRAIGYRRLVTYTLPEEGGASLRAAGWRCVGQCGGGRWNRRARPRVDTHPLQQKLRWEVS